MSNSDYKQCVHMFGNYSVLNCDDLCTSPDRVTYCNSSLGQSTFIDHFFVSSDLKPQITKPSIYASGANLSDHRPLISTLAFNSHLVLGSPINQPVSEPKHYAWRWDKSDLNLYYS
jgi:hypothetical protein